MTYLYAYDGYLRELFIRDGTVSKSIPNGTEDPGQQRDFEAKETSDGIFICIVKMKMEKDRYNLSV